MNRYRVTALVLLGTLALTAAAAIAIDALAARLTDYEQRVDSLNAAREAAGQVQ